jgi:hypothetical protein
MLSRASRSLRPIPLGLRSGWYIVIPIRDVLVRARFDLVATLFDFFKPRRNLPRQFGHPRRFAFAPKPALSGLWRALRAAFGFNRCSWYAAAAASVRNISLSKARSSNGVLRSVTIPRIVVNNPTLSCVAGHLVAQAIRALIIRLYPGC